MGETYVNPTRLIESEDLAIVEFAAKAVGNETDAKAKVLKPFYAVRDDVRYDAYLRSATLRAIRVRGRLRWVRLVCFQGGRAGRVRPLSRHPGRAGVLGCSQSYSDPKID